MAQSTDLAYRVLRLEQQLESYQKLHMQELEEIRRAVAELKEQILVTMSPRAEMPKAEQSKSVTS